MAAAFVEPPIEPAIQTESSLLTDFPQVRWVIFQITAKYPGAATAKARTFRRSRGLIYVSKAGFVRDNPIKFIT